MKYKIIVTGSPLLLFCTAIFSQYNFDSIKICHTKGGELRNIDIGEYEVKMQGGELLSLSSKDDAVKYEAGSKLFVIKNLNKGSSLNLQLSNEGVVVNTRDTSFVLSSPKSMSLATSNETKLIQALYSLNDFAFALEFKNEGISKISFATTGKFIVINLVRIQSKYTWDFAIESINHSDEVLLTYVFNKPYLLSINDDSNKVGVRLLAKKKDGFFTLLEGLRIYGNNSFTSDNSYTLQYSNSGKLKNQTSKFNLACEYQ